MVFPTTLDSFTPQALGEVILPVDVNELQTAITALEAKMGIDASAVTTTHDYKLSLITGTDKAVPRDAVATMLNKILGTGSAITLGSDANYDMYYRLSGVLVRLPIVSGKILKSTGGILVWEDETVVINASTIAKGIVEVATSAEVTAGTATGGTGALLVVTPDALAASTPTFNGQNLTNTMKEVIASDNLKLSADTERTLYNSSTFTLKKDFRLSYGGIIRLKFDYKTDNAGAAASYDVRTKNGGTAASLASGTSSSTTYVTVSNDIYVEAGARLEVYIRGTAGLETISIRNCRVYYDVQNITAGSVVTD